MSGEASRRPYPGLRPFTRGESDLFFGRASLVDEMVERLATTRLLALVGPSGSGKTSLLRAGLAAALARGAMAPAGARWVIATLSPGDRPIHDLAAALLAATADDPDSTPDADSVDRLAARLGGGPQALAEWCRAGNLPQGANLLLVVDPFEALLGRGTEPAPEDVAALVALVLAGVHAPLHEARIHAAFAMRPEALGATALFEGLADAANKGLIVVPQIRRETLRQAIMAPAGVAGGRVEPELVERLLADLDAAEEAAAGPDALALRADRLPLVQHLLGRLWSLAEARAAGGEPVLALADYEALGGIAGALSAHGREILDTILPEHRDAASIVFRTLAAGASPAEAVRRPVAFGVLTEVAGGDELAVREVVEAFRAPGNGFLLPPRPTPLTARTIVEIGHESLIRRWDQCAEWLTQEAAAAAMWRELSERAERHRSGAAGLLTGEALARFAAWWDTEQPSAFWARRYGGDFRHAAAYLAESRKAAADETGAESRRRRLFALNRVVGIAAVLALLAIVPLTVFVTQQSFQARERATQALSDAEAANTARTAAEQRADAAEAARSVAEADTRAAEAERQRAADAERAAQEAAAAASAAVLAAESERDQALAASQEAVWRADAAEKTLAAREAALRAAEAARDGALAARNEAETQAAAAEAARRTAETARDEALTARTDAEARAVAAEEGRQSAERDQQAAQAALGRAEESLKSADAARAERMQASLDATARHVSALQQAGSWNAASDLLGALWRDESAADGKTGDWLAGPLAAAFARQGAADYSVIPDFLRYAGRTGWTGTTGRFRVYALDAAKDGGNKAIAIFDALTGTVTGSFELPSGADLGTKVDLVTPDGWRAAIVTTDGQIALWAADQPSPTFVPLPSEEGGKLDLADLAPVNSDSRFALVLKRDDKPSDVLVINPAEQAVTLSIAVGELADVVGLSSIDSLDLIGFVGDALYLLVGGSDQRIVTVQVAERTADVLDPEGITGAAITPDGAVLMTLSCAGACAEQDLTGIDPQTQDTLFSVKVPVGLRLSEKMARPVEVGGKPGYEVVLERAGRGVAVDFPSDDPSRVTSHDTAGFASIGAVAFDGAGGVSAVESADGRLSPEGVKAAATLARYRMPATRQKLDLYVAPNSVAVYQSEDALRIAGVTYDGDLLVYRAASDGSFQPDAAFPSEAIGKSGCLSAIAFGATGRSLLVRHIDGSIRYVAAVGGGSGTGWWKLAPGLPGARSVALAPSEPSTDCDRPDDAPSERIVAASGSGDAFALLDGHGEAWWVSVTGGAAGAGAPKGGRAATSQSFAPLQALGGGIAWIAGDPERARVALVSGPDVSIVTADRAEGGGPYPALPRRGLPLAAAFAPDGALAVVYAGGRLTRFDEADGAWAPRFDAAVPAAAPAGLFAGVRRIAWVDAADSMLALDAKTGAPSGQARLPGDPSVTSLLSEGYALTVEWDTDSVATVALRPLPQGGALADAARLVAMRSPADPLPDAGIAAIRAEAGRATATNEASGAGCAAAGWKAFAALESRLFGDDAARPACSGEAGPGDLLAAGEGLGLKAASSGLAAMAADPAFPALAAQAASGDAAATRLLGDALASAEIGQDGVDDMAVAADALRYGAGVPAPLLKRIALGAPIPDALAEAAAAREDSDPSVEQLLAHRSERRIDDLDSLADALLRYGRAERLYRDSGRAEEARFAAARRAALARVLPDARVLEVATALETWQPTEAADAAAAPAAEATTAPVAESNAAGEAAAASGPDVKSSLDTLAQRLPGSPLLQDLRDAMDRAEVDRLAATDPGAAASLLIDLVRRGAAEGGWRPERVAELMDLADGLAAAGQAEPAFRLAVESVRQIAFAFPGPIHADADAVALFRRAAAEVTATAPNVPRPVVAAARPDLAMPFVAYGYDTLPAIGADAEIAAAEGVLSAAADMTEAVARASDDPADLSRQRAEDLFWRGVLVNDHDPVSAAAILSVSAGMLRPLAEAAPDDLPLQLAYAEALRWAGFAAPASLQTAATEAEAVSVFHALWDKRAGLDDALLLRAGNGYGFALANLARTMRETKVAAAGAEAKAADNVDWVLESLALAADRERLAAAMTEAGVVEGDASFATGWYRMSAYGHSLGYLGGLVHLESAAEPATACDRLAADLSDPKRRAPGVPDEALDGAAAEPACRAEVDADPADIRATYQLARVIAIEPDRRDEFLPLAKKAADAGMALGYSLIADALNGDNDGRSGQAYVAAAQHMIIETFATLYPLLSGHASTPREHAGLAWLVEQAAALGVPEAQFELADTAPDTHGKLFRLRLAARLWIASGDMVRAQEAGRLADALAIGGDEAEQVAKDVAAWTPDGPIGLPEPDTSGSI